MDSVYNPLKILHHIDSYKCGRPVYAQVDLVNVCNHHCIRCSELYHESFRLKDRLSSEMVMSFLSDFYDLGGKAIEWTGGGEPLLSPIFPESALRALELGLECGLITNGELMKESHVLILERFKYVRVSVDAVTVDMFQGLRGIHSDLSHVGRIVGWLRGRVLLGASFIIQPENYQEIFPFAKWVRDIGYDNVRFSFVWTPQGTRVLLPYRGAIKEQVLKAKELETDEFCVFAQEERLVNVWDPRRYRHCYYSDLTIALAANGKLYHCCTWKSNPLGEWGDLNLYPLSYWWEKKLVVDAQKCPPCWMDKKNEAMGYLLLESPAHVNFV